MKSVFILAAVVMVFAGCGSSSDGSFGTSSVEDSTIVIADTTEVVVSTINEPSRVDSLPPIPAFPSE